MRHFWLIPLAITFELIGLFLFIKQEYEFSTVLFYGLVHTVSCGILTEVMLKNLPVRYRRNRFTTRAFIFCMQFFIPFVGGIGLLFGIMIPIWIPRKNRQLPWQEIATAELPYRPNNFDEHAYYSQGGLRQVLQSSSDEEKRIKAVLATNQLEKRQAISILQHSLSDPSDDVRLLAYACLDTHEKEISNVINKYYKELETASPDRSITVKKLLAQSYWEMAYLGLSTGSIKEHFLNSARKLLEEVIAVNRDCDLMKLYGRILLALNLYQDSTLAFYIALAKGAPRKQILPYLAEALFLQGRYEQMKQFLNEYKLSNPETDSFTPVLEYWNPSD